MGKGANGTRMKTSTSGGVMNKVAKIDGVKKAYVEYNEHSGDNVYTIEYDRFDSTEVEQVRIRRAANEDGYHTVSLPTGSNNAVVSATKMILDSNKSNMSIDVEVGSREERAAQRYGFVSGDLRREYGIYYKTYTRQKNR